MMPSLCNRRHNLNAYEHALRYYRALFVNNILLGPYLNSEIQRILPKQDRLGGGCYGEGFSIRVLSRIAFCELRVSIGKMEISLAYRDSKE